MKKFSNFEGKRRWNPDSYPATVEPMWNVPREVMVLFAANQISDLADIYTAGSIDC